MALFLILIFILKHFFNNSVDINIKRKGATMENKLENIKEKRREAAMQISHQAERYGIQEIHIVE